MSAFFFNFQFKFSNVGWIHCRATEFQLFQLFQLLLWNKLVLIEISHRIFGQIITCFCFVWKPIKNLNTKRPNNKLISISQWTNRFHKLSLGVILLDHVGNDDYLYNQLGYKIQMKRNRRNTSISIMNSTQLIEPSIALMSVIKKL